MKKRFVKFTCLLLISISYCAKAQTSIGIEAGVNFASNSPSVDQKTLFLRNGHPGLSTGLFIEQQIRRKKMAIRTSLLYSIRFFLYGKSDPNFVNAHRAFHCLSLPVLASFQASPKLSFDIGIELIGILHNDLPNFQSPRLHIGPRVAIAYQISPIFALRLYGVYDLIKIRQDNAPNSTNFNYYNQVTIGLKLAYTFQKIKRKTIIRSPGI